ncbi:hypothetical protein CSA37_08865 [Candidatus Fermentibacteria bacterium]|nr:MAG: hypothetical protein CSA37_08865 [Candidatus Fermentibacteria bacterium]
MKASSFADVTGLLNQFRMYYFIRISRFQVFFSTCTPEFSALTRRLVKCGLSSSPVLKHRREAGSSFE